MINIDLIAIIIFYGLLILLFIKKREKFEVQGKVFALYKTKLGLKLMDRIGNFSPRVMKWVGYVGVVVGFSGMSFIFYFLIKETFNFVTTPGAIPPLAPVLPGVAIPGAPVLSFWHWIIAIFIVAVVHEFSHGVMARTHGIKIKSSGFAFMGPILAAFVEPEEKEMVKKKKMAQLSVFAAGPFSNIILGFLFIALLVFVSGPLVGSMYQPGGTIVSAFVEGYPAVESGLELPFTIKQINGEDTMEFVQFVNVITKINPDDEINLVTDQGEFDIIAGINPDNSSRGFMGIAGFQQKRIIKESLVNFEWLAKFMIWFNLLISWLFLINIGVGLFNLLPLGPVDGGRMFITAATAIFKNERIAIKLFAIVSWICLLLIFINLWPWVMRLITWLGKGFLFLLAVI